jgi:hypothetical protein
MSLVKSNNNAGSLEVSIIKSKIKELDEYIKRTEKRIKQQIGKGVNVSSVVTTEYNELKKAENKKDVLEDVLIDIEFEYNILESKKMDIKKVATDDKKTATKKHIKQQIDKATTEKVNTEAKKTSSKKVSTDNEKMDNKKVMKEAWRIRKEAAIKKGVKTTDIEWNLCLSEAKILLSKKK